MWLWRPGRSLPASAEPEPTGIDYLRILDAAHGAELQAQINYAALIDDVHHGGTPGADGADRTGTGRPEESGG